MNVTDQQPQGPTSGVTPHLTIHDNRAVEAIAFYEQAFGATEFVRMPAEDGVRVIHSHLGVNGASIMLNDAFPEFVPEGDRSSPTGSQAVTLHLQVDDADRWFDRAIAAGASVVMPPADMFWGDRYAQVKDPFGHRWAFGSPLAERP